MFLWRLQHKRLPTRWALSNRGITIDNIMCALCDAVPEQVNHLFFSCCLAKELWCKLARWCQIALPVFVDVEEMWSWIEIQHRSRVNKVILEVLFGSLIWVIWTYRNAVVFGDGSYRKDMLFDNFIRFSFNWYMSRNHKVARNWTAWVSYPLMN